jgi:hypothetical protein
MNSILWQQNGAKIVRHFEGCYTLEYRGKPVMEATNFDAVSRYVWAEFL